MSPPDGYQRPNIFGFLTAIHHDATATGRYVPLVVILIFLLILTGIVMKFGFGAGVDAATVAVAKSGWIGWMMSAVGIPASIYLGGRSARSLRHDVERLQQQLDEARSLLYQRQLPAASEIPEGEASSLSGQDTPDPC
ncbi:MAG: hypothetical protein IAE99_07975 [Rhodothermales bacterium]|nr:hypothetical protein [Rhodothermales bacterium]